MSADLSSLRTAAEVALVKRFEEARPYLPGTDSIAHRRAEAFAAFTASGLPHRRVEDWKYTDLRAFMRDAPPLALKPEADQAARILEGSHLLAGLGMAGLTFVNGHLVGDTARLPAGIEVVPLGIALADGHRLLAHMGKVEVARGNVALDLNTAFMSDGAVIDVTAAEAPAALHLRFVNGSDHPIATAPRVLVVVEAGAELTLVETHEGPGGIDYHVNSVVDLVVGEGARVAHVRVNGEGHSALALSTLTAHLSAGANLVSVGLTSGAAVSRHQVFLAFAGEGANATVGGATMARGRQHMDTTLVVDHAVPHCNSRELFKTVIDEDAVGVFQGKIIVRPHAQKTDGRMMSAALLLGEGATMNNKPELEIFADDVQCAHGATCGELDEEQLFYLMARGLPRADAEALMVEAFLVEALDLIADDGLREALSALAGEWLRGRT